MYRNRNDSGKTAALSTVGKWPRSSRQEASRSSSQTHTILSQRSTRSPVPS